MNRHFYFVIFNRLRDIPPEPIPLSEDLSATLPRARLDILPGVFGEYGLAVSRTMEVSPEVVLATMLPVMTMMARPGCRIAVDRAKQWSEAIVIQSIGVSRSGGLKSPAQKAVTAPISALEKKLARENRDKNVALAVREDRAKRELFDARKKGNATPEEETRLNIAYENAKAAARKRTKCTFDNITPETLYERLAEHEGKLILVTSEGRILDMMTGAYSAQPDTEPYKVGYDGGTLRFDRRTAKDGTRTEIVTPCAQLTLSTLTQPSRIARFSRARELWEDGTLARVLWHFDPHSGEPTGNGDPMPMNLAEEFEARFLACAEFASSLAYLSVAPEALASIRQFRYVELRNEIQPKAEPGEAEGLRKLTGNLVRIAGCFALARMSGVVSSEDWSRAVALAPFYIAHLRHAAGVAGGELSEDHQDAQKILAYLMKQRKSRFSKTDLRTIRNKWPKDAPKRLASAIALLVEHRYIQGSGPWEVHPSL